MTLQAHEISTVLRTGKSKQEWEKEIETLEKENDRLLDELANMEDLWKKSDSVVAKLHLYLKDAEDTIQKLEEELEGFEERDKQKGSEDGKEKTK